MIDALIAMCRRPVPVERVCLKLGVSETQLAKLVKKAQAGGYVVKLVDGHVTSRVAVSVNPSPVSVGDSRPGWKVIASISDTHFGSKHCDEDAVLAHLRRAWSSGARVCLHSGDVLDGCKSVLLPDQQWIGWDHQAERLQKLLKKAPAFTYLAIDGNHDLSFSEAVGSLSGRILSDTLRGAGVDWRYLGNCLGRARVHGARVELWHPHGGASTRNAVRRVLNERAEALQDNVHMIQMGHLHKHVSFQAFPENTHCLAGGTFQRKGSAFSNRIAREWDIGGSVTRFLLDKNGIPSHFSSEFFPAL